MRRVTAVLCTIVIGALAFLPARSSAAVGGCAGGEDYNGDGFADLAIGVLSEDIGAAAGAGAVQIVYGGSGGVSSAGDQVFHQDTDGMNDTAESEDFFGLALASGDFDGDGFDDLAVGVPGEGIGLSDNAGAVQIIYGSATGLSSAGDQVFHRGTTDIEGEPHGGSGFGGSVAACDFNGDGRDDLAVGVPFDEVSSDPAGSVSVLYGGPGGLSAAGDQLFHQDVLSDAAETDDLFGTSLAAGDFNADGRGDLAVGVPGEDLESVPVFNVGAIHMLYGGASGLSAAGNQVFHQDSPGMNETAEGDEAFGWAVTSGDFNGDGFDDLTIGVPFEDIGETLEAAGAIQVIYGGPGGLSTSGDQVFHQETAGMNDASAPFDLFGNSLASGDFDGDGFDDVAVGVPFENLGGNDNEGEVQIVYGTSAGLSSAGDQVFHQDTPGMNDTAEIHDEFATTVTSGDLNGDGFDDLTNGIPRESGGEGAVQVVYGTSAGLSSAGDQVFHQDTDGMNDHAESNDLFGAGLVLSPHTIFLLD